MIFHPPILALIAASAISSAVMAAAAIFAYRLLREWYPSSGSQTQIELERVTYLTSTVVVFVLAVEAASLILFAANADRMAPLFVGAMCAFGTLNASVWGFPALWAKIAVFFAAFVWVVIDRVDNSTRDYGLIRVKYASLLALAPLVIAESALELAYFLDLSPDTVTSCCSKVFVSTRRDLGGDLASLDPRLSLTLLAVGLVAAIGLGLAARRHRALALAHSAASLVVFGLALAAIVAAIGPYVYELPHHHCPFCILKGEYDHVGYALYLPLFLATGSGIASGALALFRDRIDAAVEQNARRRLARTAIVGHMLFAVVSTYLVMRSGLSLG